MRASRIRSKCQIVRRERNPIPLTSFHSCIVLGQEMSNIDRLSSPRNAIHFAMFRHTVGSVGLHVSKGMLVNAFDDRAHGTRIEDFEHITGPAEKRSST